MRHEIKNPTFQVWSGRTSVLTVHWFGGPSSQNDKGRTKQVLSSHAGDPELGVVHPTEDRALDRISAPKASSTESDEFEGQVRQQW